MERRLEPRGAFCDVGLRMNADVSFTRLSAGDLPLLHEWLSRPHVAAYWDEPIALQDMAGKFAAHMRSEIVFGYVASLDGVPAAYVQTYAAAKVGGGWWPNEAAGTWGVDQFLADGARLGQGLGTQLVRALVAFVFARHGADAIITDPRPDNLRAVRCYEKAGFRRIGVVETPDGPALLMRIERPEMP
jgi:RimJ/RimL family protein N-acetyltransferase